MKEVKVYRLYFTQSDCYKKAMKITPSGVQVHSTGANNPYLKRYVGPDDGNLGENKFKNYHNNPGIKVCANAYIGKLNNNEVAIYQALPWDYCCWLSGSAANGNANKMGYVGFEICEDDKKDKTYFEQAVMGQSVLLTAWLCQTYNIPINNVRDHHELYTLGLASNHADIGHWLKIYGLTMDDYRDAVLAAMKEGVKIKYMDEPTPLYTAIVVTDNNRVVNLRSEPKVDEDGKNIIARLSNGTEIEVLEKVNESWSKVTYRDIIGYISNNFITVKTEEEVIDVPVEKLKDIKQRLADLLDIVDTLLSNT